MDQADGVAVGGRDIGFVFFSQQVHMRPYIQERLILAGVGDFEMEGLNFVGFDKKWRIDLCFSDATRSKADDFHHSFYGGLLKKEIDATGHWLIGSRGRIVDREQDNTTARHYPSELPGKIFETGTGYISAIVGHNLPIGHILVYFGTVIFRSVSYTHLRAH